MAVAIRRAGRRGDSLTIVDHATFSGNTLSAMEQSGRRRRNRSGERGNREQSSFQSGLGEAPFGRGVAITDPRFAAFLEVQQEVDGDPGAAGPVGVRRVGAVADDVAVHGGAFARDGRDVMLGLSRASFAAHRVVGKG